MEKNLFQNMTRSLSNLRCSSIVFLLTSCFTLVLVIFSTVTNTVFNCIDKQERTYSSIVFSMILIVGCFILCYFCFDAILKENEFQLFMFCGVLLVFSVGVIGYVVYKIFNVQDILTGSNILRFIFILAPCIGIILCDLIFLLLIYNVYLSFGWSLFNLIGTNRVLIRLYKTYHIFLTLMKGDFALVILLMIIIVFFSPLRFSYDPFGMCPICIAVTFGGMILAYVAVRTENIFLHIIFLLISSTIVPLYLLYKFVISIVYSNDPFNAYDNPFSLIGWTWRVEYGYTITVMNLLIALFFFLRIVMLIAGIFVGFNFNKGLKEVFLDQEKTYSDKSFFIKLLHKA